MLKKVNRIFYIITHLPITIVHLILAFIIITITKYLFFPASLKSKIYGKVKRYVFHLGYSMLERFFPARFTVVHKKIPNMPNPKHSIIISNHVSDYDWMYIAYTAEKDGYFEDLKITMKQELRKLPFLGNLLKSFGSVFLSRSHNKTEQTTSDIEKMASACRKIVEDGGNFNVLLFPEGTYIESQSLLNSQEYHDKFTKSDITSMKIFKPTRVLLPHIAGFQKILLSKPEDLKVIRDITLFTTPYTPFVYDDYKYSQLALGDMTFHENLLIEIIPIPDDIQNCIRDIHTSDKNEDSHKYKKSMKQFQESTTAFLNELFLKKQEMIEAYEKEHQLDEKQFLDFCKNYFKDSAAELSMEVYNVRSPFKFLYRGLPLVTILLIVGLSVYCLLYRKVPFVVSTQAHAVPNLETL